MSIIIMNIKIIVSLKFNICFAVRGALGSTSVTHEGGGIKKG